MVLNSITAMVLKIWLIQCTNMLKKRGNISLPLELLFIRAVKQLPNHMYVTDLSIKNFPQEKLSNTLHHGSLDFNNFKNQNFLKQATKYLVKTV